MLNHHYLRFDTWQIFLIDLISLYFQFSDKNTHNLQIMAAVENRGGSRGGFRGGPRGGAGGPSPRGGSFNRGGPGGRRY